MRRVKFGEKSGAWVLSLLGIVLLAAAGLKAHLSKGLERCASFV